MSDNGKDLVVASGRGLPHGYPFNTVSLAVALCLNSRSVAEGHRRLQAELEPHGLDVPDYRTVFNWAKGVEECYAAVTGDRKREMVALASEVASEAAGRMIQALPGLSDSQIPVAYGIAMQRRTDWDKTGQAGPVTAVQINITDSKGGAVSLRKAED